MKLSQMINTKDENKAKEVANQENFSEISQDDKAEFDALMSIANPDIPTPEVEQDDMDDATKAEVAELKSFAGM